MKAFEVSARSVYSYFEENARCRGDRPAYVCEDRELSWRQAFSLYRNLISFLRAAGVGEGSFVALCARRRVLTPVALLAAVSAGATVIPLDPSRDAKRQLGEFAPDLPVKYFLTPGDECFVLEREGEELRCPLEERSPEGGFAPSLTCDKTRASFLMFTSGSTGANKGVALSEYTMLNNTRNQIIGSGGDETDRTVLVVPLFHVFGLAVVLGALAGGSAVLVPVSREPRYVLEFLSRFRVTRIDTVPTYYLMLAEEQKKGEVPLFLVRGIIAGGAYSKEQFAAAEKALGVTLYPSYGMTETSTVISFLGEGGSFEARSGSVGKFMPGIEGALLRDGKAVPHGETGEVCVRGYCLALGYLAGKIEPLPLDGEGYFHTGDLGVLDGEGNLTIVGRCKDIIIRGGENLSPYSIERKIFLIGGVRRVCVVPIASELYGEEVGACVVADLSEEALCALLPQYLPKREVPAKVVLVEELPSLPSGKPDRAEIARLLAR